MHHNRLISILKSIVSQPTAPFHEYHVRAEIIRQLQEIPEVSLQTTPYGNLIARYRGKKPRPVQWVIGSHMDHPGWVYDSSGEPEFLGGVRDIYFQNRKNWNCTRDFGDFAMWDVTDFELKDGHIHGRACDDLIGCGLIVAMFSELSSIGWPGSCAAAFTRAEEVGFVGATHLADHWPFPKSAVFLSLETSAPAGEMKIGSGPVCRTGDRRSVFDNEATASLVATAEGNSIPYQRSLLDKGACEATALQAFGIRCAGISVPLGNYHNQGPANRIAAEFVNLGDVKATLQLLVSAISSGIGSDTAGGGLKKALKTRRKQYNMHLKVGNQCWEKFDAGS